MIQHSPTNPALAAIIARARLAVTGRPDPYQAHDPAPALTSITAPASLTPSQKAAAAAPLGATLPSWAAPEFAPAPPAAVRVRHNPRQPAPLSDVVELDALSDGPRRLLSLLHRLACDLLRVKGWAVVPSVMVLHQSQQLLARALGVCRETVWRWTCDLKERGLLDARPHKGTTTHKGKAVTRNDGTLYAVALRPHVPPRLRWHDLKHKYRDLDADRREGKTAYQTLNAEMQQSNTYQEPEWYQVLLTWAVTPGNTNLTPVECVDCCTELNTVQDVVYALPLVAVAHPAKRAALIGQLGAALARALGDLHSRRWYCGLIWQAWRDEREQRPGLQSLAAQIARLDADRSEWTGLSNPAALLASRLTPAH